MRHKPVRVRARDTIGRIVEVCAVCGAERLLWTLCVRDGEVLPTPRVDWWFAKGRSARQPRCPGPARPTDAAGGAA